ncbi:hypothetical protein RJ639_011176 [Escallonia herrerae]|uniref:Uncharacterized protein n=1 Tax=Escallonia herrerae TaxID=1293975 RepID=A0AA89AR38_9ASTE|nr:hypothetical protein RJ639_011176 [Escallonia herrerae]
MMFLLTALKVQYVLDPNLPPLPDITDNDSDETKAARKKREEDELVCRGHILNALSDRLYDLFTSSKCPKEIWKALENKYNNEKQGADKFLTLKYFEFTMNDSESVLDQVHQLQILVSKLKDLKVEVLHASLFIYVLILSHEEDMNTVGAPRWRSDDASEGEEQHSHDRLGVASYNTFTRGIKDTKCIFLHRNSTPADQYPLGHGRRR